MKFTTCPDCGGQEVPLMDEPNSDGDVAVCSCGWTAQHACPGSDDDGRALKPYTATCGSCGLSWCDRCDPVAVSAGCHYCSGRGYSTAPMDDD